MKKILSTIMVLAMMLALAACGNSETQTQENGSNETSVTPAAEQGNTAPEENAPTQAADPETTPAGSEGQETAEKTEGADFVFVNGYIYTSDEKNPTAEALAVKDGIITYVGSNGDEVNALIGDNTKVVDLTGKMMTPNLIDAHTHIATVGMTDWHVRMPIYESVEEILDFVSAYLNEHPMSEEGFVYFDYYPSEMFGEKGPRKEVLDAIAPDRPVLVEDFSDHACWVNSEFLRLTGIDQITEDSAFYEFFIRDENGELTGWILEGKWKEYAPNMYETINWYPAEECTPDVMSVVTNDLKSWGTTSVLNAFVEDEMQVASIRELDDNGLLNMYYEDAVVMYDFSVLEDCISEIHYLDETYGNDHINVDTLKIFYDGTNELGDAALVDGTVADPDYHGYLMMDLEETKQVIRRCNEEGIDVHFHMVGDLAFRQVCDAVEELIAELGSLDSQVELCHCELINPEDYNRPAELGIIVNWTPHWTGGYFGEASMIYLGEERYNIMYQFNPLFDSGAIVTFGSDVYSMYEENRANPYFGMQTAMTRVDIEYPLDCGMRPSEDAKLSLERLLKGYTINAAIQMRIDDKTGSLEVGKGANLNIYSVNLFEVDENEFKDVLPETVMFEGKVISGEIK